MSLSTPETIKAMWDQRAQSTPLSEKVTHRDTFQRQLEVEELARHLRPGDVVLDVGCGNGWATAQLARHCRRITGMDYSAAMVERARAEQAGVANADWQVGDVLALQTEAAFDVVVTVRCLINIVTRGGQWKALANLARALAPGGRLLLMEGIQDGREGLNRAREAVGLSTMPAVHHNLDFRLGETTAYLRTLFSSVEFRANGVYDVVTRLLYPLMVRPEEPSYESPYHEAAFALSRHLHGHEGLSRFGLFRCVK
jgi:SAM-dependent methyltransferase